ncbi:hypothetical protein SLS62_009629 [Diatrype stigma]|uniref:Uncharacterized protein n=1 Tax=Diatrype stigma TaxID=117547 RepID=A0AAN9ULV3_9PEZI
MDQRGDGTSPRPKVELVASTGDIAATTTRHTSSGSDGAYYSAAAAVSGNGKDSIRSYFESAQWTADGTTILTYSSSHLIQGYIVPEDLLSPDKPAPLPLAPQAVIQLPERSDVLAAAPYFSLAEPYTNQVLASARDHPIQLFYLSSSPSPPPSPSPSTTTAAAAVYPFTKTSRSETFLSASSLIWPGPGSHFVAGSRSLLAKFDASRPGAGSEPVLRVKTIPSERHLLKGGGVGMRGTVSALGAQPDSSSPYASPHLGLVAAGTWTRWVGLYDFGGAGECVAAWSVAGAETGEGKKAVGTEIGGSGITQTVWSPCGRYLLVAERRARGVLVYDVRVTGRLLACLTGRDAADSSQRIACDVFPGSPSSSSGGGFEVWSGTAAGAGGGGGGMVKVWEGVGAREGAHEPSWAWRAHDDPSTTVGAACLHPSGSVVATCAGSWTFSDGDGVDGEASSPSSSAAAEAAAPEAEADDLSWMWRRNRESSLKIWSITSDGSDGGNNGGNDGYDDHDDDHAPEGMVIRGGPIGDVVL